MASSTGKRAPTAIDSADMAAARRRSNLYGIDRTSGEVPHVGQPRPAAEAMTTLSGPVLDDMLQQIGGSSLALVLADRQGRLTRRDAPAFSTLAAMDDRSVNVGYSLSETDVGTNGVGTSLETKRPTLVVGDDHHLECFHAFACANAPIIHPVKGRVEGTVGLLCPVDEAGPLLLPTAMQLASRISQLILGEASPLERFLLEDFLRRRTSAGSAVATLGRGVLIASPSAQRVLIGLDQAELWNQVQAAAANGVATITVETPSGEPIEVRCQPLHRGGELSGAAVTVRSRPARVGRRHRIRRQHRLGDLVGVSDAWRSIVADSVAATTHTEPVLVVGERGSGRLSVAKAIASRSESRSVEVLDSAEVLIEGPRSWVLRARDALAQDKAVVFRRIEQLSDEVASAVAATVTGSTTGRALATAESTEQSDPALAALIRVFDVDRIAVPALRERRQDIPPLIRHLAGALGRHHVDARMVGLLSRQSWPGNVSELRQALLSAHTRARTESLAVRHLPRHLQVEDKRIPLHGLAQQEAEAIISAINSSSTRTEAARRLGISRATLYRRIRDYGLDVDG